MGYLIKQNQTARPLVFLMVNSTDHVSPKTGLTPTVTLSKNGAPFTSPAGGVSEIGNGWYKVDGNSTDSNTLGPLLLHATAAGADPTDDRFDVVAYDPNDARVDVGKWLGAAIPAPSMAGIPVVDIGYVAGLSASTVSGPIDANMIQVAGQSASAAGPINFSNLDATVSSRSTLDAPGLWSYPTRTLTSFGFTVNVGTNLDKTGYTLASNGLDAINTAAPAGNPVNFREMLVMVYRRFFKKAVLDGNQIRTFADDGTTVLTTQAVSSSGTTEIQEAVA